MRWLLLTLGFIFALSIMPSKQPRISDRTLMSLYLAQQVLDAGMTGYAVSKGATEMNPAMKPFTGKLSTLVSYKGATIWGGKKFLDAMKKENPKAYRKTLISLNVLHGLLTLSNIIQLSKAMRQ